MLEFEIIFFILEIIFFILNPYGLRFYGDKNGVKIIKIIKIGKISKIEKFVFYFTIKVKFI